MIGKSLVIFHYFCSNCQTSLETKDEICQNCGQVGPSNHFLELPLFNQLESMFYRAGFYDALQFRFTRTKKYPNNIEDIYDGQIYQEQMENGFLRNPNNISFMWYTDGLSLFKSSQFSIWPMFLVVNELNYKARTSRENVILAGLWFGREKPNPNLFMGPLHSDMSVLENEGHLFERSDGPPVLVKGKLLLGVADLQAKNHFMRQRHCNGFYGCTICTTPGQRFPTGPNSSVHVYPYTPEVNLRNNADIPRLARQATEERRLDPDADVLGIKGPTLLYDMLPNMILCMGIDTMHGCFLGLMKLLISLWFDTAYEGQPFSIRHLLPIVDARLKDLQPPSNVQRMPRSIAKLIKFWKALEYKLMFFYYSLPVMLGVLPENYWRHHCKLVSAIAILHQESISRDQINAARHLLHSYLSDFEDLYGLRYMGINVHQLVHLPNVAINLGPNWVYSCYFFEGLNGSIANLVHGTRYAAMQICSAVSAFLTLPVRVKSLRENNPIREFCEKMLSGGQTRVKILAEINPETYAVGSYAPCDPVPPFITDALADGLNIVNGRCQYFFKLKKKGVLYFADNYPRDVQKQSSYALLSDNDVPHLCRIECFIKWTPCNAECPPTCLNCPGQFICIVRLYRRIPWEVHNVPDAIMSYLNRVNPTDDIRAFPVNYLHTLCFYMCTAVFEYIALPVNTLEVE